MTNAFDTESEAVASEEFIFAGSRFRPGDRFPHRDLKLAAVELGGLWKGGRIRFTGERYRAPDAKPEPEPAKTVEPETKKANRK
jgi:hypothetical protein